MSHLNPGLLGAYNSLTDKHLTSYFNNTRIRRHLQKVGLLSRSGRIIPEKEYRHKLIQRAHQRHVRECLAQAIFHKVLDMERLHQIEIKRRLEDFARRERVHKIKVERSNRYEEEHTMMFSPRPPTGPKNSHARHSGPEGEHSESTESPASSRPNTAPGKMQRPVRLKPLNSTSTPGSRKRNSSRYRNQDSSNETDHPFSSPLERDAPRHLTLTDFSSSVSPYRLPVINNFVTPVPPLTKRKEKGSKGNGTLWGRRLRPTTAPSAADTQEGTIQRGSAQSTVIVKMIYFGKSVHLSHDLMDLRDEVKVFQQHCGGENLCVYKGRVKEGETFLFVSRRHRGFPFSLTFFLNGLQVERLSSCCEFKHRKGSRLGGRHGHFGFTGVEGASPCYRCIIAMGLDKKPTPPKRAKEDPLHSTSRENLKEEEAESVQLQKSESDARGENKPRNEYEEDFEADDEGPVEDGGEEGNKTTPSPTREEDEKRGKKDENENEVPEKKQDSDIEPGDKKVKNKSPSISSGLSGSSFSCDEEEKEGQRGPEQVDEEDVPEEQVEPESRDSTFTSEKDTQMEETEAVESGSVSLPQQIEDESQTQDSAVEKSEEEVLEETERDDRESEKPGEEEPAVAENQVREDEDEKKVVEQERAKSVQEKLAEAILNVAECTSEPEFSDTTTEEDEVASVRTQQDSPGAEAVSSKQEKVSKESTVEPLEPASEASMIDGDADDTEKHTETNETSQPEPKVETTPEASEDISSKQEEETNEQNYETHDVESIQENPQKEISEEAEVNETKIDSDNLATEKDNKEQEEVKEEGAEDDNLAETSDNQQIAQVEYLLVRDPEEEDKTEDILVEETDVDSKELKEANTDPQPENPVETAVADNEGAGDAHSIANQDTEAESQKQTENESVNAENGEEEVHEKTSAGDKVEEGDDAEVDAVEEKDTTDVMRPADVWEGIEKDVEKVEEKNRTTENNVASKTNLEVSETENKSEEEKVEEKLEKAELGDEAANIDEQKETESIVEQDTEDDGETGENSKENNKLKEGSKENGPLKEDETDGEFKTEQDIEVKADSKEDDGQGETKSAVEKDKEAEDRSKSDTLTKPDEQLKETESVKEDGSDRENHGEVVADKVQNSFENNGQDEAEIKAKEIVEASQDEAGEEKTVVDAGGEDIPEEKRKEGFKLKETSADKDSQVEENGREDVTQKMENVEEGKEDVEIVKEETIEDGANQENVENVEVSETENVPEESGVESKEEKPEEDAGVRELESSVEMVAELGDESKSEEDMDNKTPEDAKENALLKENEIKNKGKPEENAVVKDLDCKEKGEEQIAEVGKDEFEIEEGAEPDAIKLEGDSNEQNKEDPMESDGAQEAQSSDEQEKVDAADGNSEKDEISLAKIKEDEAATEEVKEEIDYSDPKQGTTNEKGLQDEQEDQTEKAPSITPDASNNADPEAEVPVDANTTAEEPTETGSEMKSTDIDLPDEEIEVGKHDAAENVKNADEEDSSSSASPSEESQPAEKVTALRREDKELGFSEDAELLSTPPVDQGDLVSNWVNIHQASRYFETFVEPLDDIKSLISQEGDRKVNGEHVDEVEETMLSTKDSGSGEGDETSETAKDERVPLKTDLEDFEGTLVESLKVETKSKAESHTSSNQSKDTKNVSEGKEDAEAKDMVANSESVFTSGEQQAVTLDNVVNLSETPVMKFEISQDS